jgi:hypothetical protein
VQPFQLYRLIPISSETDAVAVRCLRCRPASPKAAPPHARNVGHKTGVPVVVHACLGGRKEACGGQVHLARSTWSDRAARSTWTSLTHARALTHTQLRPGPPGSLSRARTHTHARAHARARTRAHTHARARAYTHTRAHTHTRTVFRPGPPGPPSGEHAQGHTRTRSPEATRAHKDALVVARSRRRHRECNSEKNEVGEGGGRMSAGAPCRERGALHVCVRVCQSADRINTGFWNTRILTMIAHVRARGSSEPGRRRRGVKRRASGARQARAEPCSVRNRAGTPRAPVDESSSSRRRRFVC